MFIILLLIVISGIFISLFKFLQSRNPSRTYKINDYLSLKLEDGRTNIYVKNRLFRQCMYLLLNIQKAHIREYDEIESIDEAAETLDRSMESNPSIRSRVTPEEEFLGHCSNVQAWTENGYDTRILHRNLAFPLLKRLSEVGDPQARKVFKEEIAIRLASGYPTVGQFLIENGYLKFLNSDEFESIIEDIELPGLNYLIENLNLALESYQNSQLKIIFNYFINNLTRNFGIQNIPIIFSYLIKQIPEEHRENIVVAVYEKYKKRRGFPLFQFLNNNIEFFKDYDFEYVGYNNRIIGFIKDNKLYLRNKNIEDITKLEGLKDKEKNVEELDLSNNLITEIKQLSNFSNLISLKINNNRISEIKNLNNLRKLKVLSLKNNKISKIAGLEDLKSLKYLDLSGNTNIQSIPSSLLKLDSLEKVKLWNCNLLKFDNSTSKFFWNDQNYRYFKGYTQKDKEYYESTHNRKASSNNKLYKHFVQWVLKFKSLMEKYEFNYKDLERFESETSKKAFWSGRITNTFIKWLFDKYQMKIIEFL